jgi:hypothetical protein
MLDSRKPFIVALTGMILLLTPLALVACTGSTQNSSRPAKAAETPVRIEPAETGRAVVIDYEGVPAPVRSALPKYTNAYVSEIEGFDYREGIAVLGTAGVSDEEMLRVRDTINVVLLADPRMRRGLAEYNAHIGVMEGEPEEGTDLLDALLMMRPIELVYTDIEGINEVGLNGGKSSVPQKLMQLLAYYPIPDAPYFAETKAALAAAYETAVETGVYDPTSYLDPDFAHPGILMAPGAYLGLAYEIYHGMPAGPSEYQIRDREDMSARDPLMFRFLDFTRPEWFDYGQLLHDYANEIHRLDGLGMLEQEARTDAQ